MLCMAAMRNSRVTTVAGTYHLVVFAHAGADSAEGQLQIELPGVLQKQLLDQYDAIHDEGKLLQLPRRPNVMQVRTDRVTGGTGCCALEQQLGPLGRLQLPQ